MRPQNSDHSISYGRFAQIWSSFKNYGRLSISRRIAIRHEAVAGPRLTRRVRSYAGLQRQRARDMTEPLALTTDHVDDSPLLGAQPERVGLQPLLDEHVPAHGNWVCLSLD